MLKTILGSLDKVFGKNWKKLTFGVSFILVLLERAAEILFGFHVPVLSSALDMIVTYLSGANPGAPDIGTTVTAVITGIAGVVTLIQTMLRYVLKKEEV